MRIGIDFDNTIAGYDRLFGTVARELGVLDGGVPATKAGVRDALRARGEEGETDYQRVQGQAYGRFMAGADLIEGVGDFLAGCRSAGNEVFIVSHKTSYGHFDDARVNLREAALGWMESKGFFDPDGYGIARGNVYFEDTRDAKIARIRSLEVTHFIDDLNEVLSDPAFPADVTRILYSPQRAPDTDLKSAQHWNEISACLL